MKLLKLVLAFGFVATLKAQGLPTFKDQKVNDYVKAYADFVKEYKKSKGNPKNISATLNKLSVQGKDVFKGLKDDETKKLSDYIESVFKQISEVPVEKVSEKKAIETALKDRKPLSSVDGIKVPTLKDKALNSYVQNYAHYINDFLALKGEYSETLNKRAEGLTKTAQKVITDKISKEDSDKLATFMTAINKKIGVSN